MGGILCKAQKPVNDNQMRYRAFVHGRSRQSTVVVVVEMNYVAHPIVLIDDPDMRADGHVAVMFGGLG